MRWGSQSLGPSSERVGKYRHVTMEAKFLDQNNLKQRRPATATAMAMLTTKKQKG